MSLRYQLRVNINQINAQRHYTIILLSYVILIINVLELIK